MKIYTPPLDVLEPAWDDYRVDGEFSMEKMREVEDKYLADLEASLRNLGFTGKLTGKIWRYPVADGYAQYMVAHAPGGKPSMALVHVPLGDAWHIDAATARGLRQVDVKAYVTAKPLFGEMR